MLELPIPGRPTLRLQHLILDYNGTIAVDGLVTNGVPERLDKLATRVDIHIITADTFGLASVQTGGFPVNLKIIPAGMQVQAKLDLVEALGAESVVAIGNGANDHLMLKKAALGICVLGREGAATQTLIASDVVVQTAEDALDLLLQPGRLAATLRI